MQDASNNQNTRDTPLTFDEAATLIYESGAKRRPHRSTMWRWAMVGINGVKLRSAKIGGRRYTSAEALQQFIDELNE